MNIFYKHSVMLVGIALTCFYGTAQAATTIGGISSDVIVYDAIKTINITPSSSTADPTFEAWTTGSTPSCAIVSSTRTSVTYSALHPTSTIAPVIGCTIHISQAGDGITPAATKDIAVTVSKAPQEIFVSLPSDPTAGQTFDLFITGTGSDKPITVNQNPLCPVDTSALIWTITPAVSGSCTFSLNKKGNEYYTDLANKPVTITSAKGNTVIDFINPPNPLVLQYNKSIPLTVKKTGSTSVLTGATSTGSICSVSTTPNTVSPFTVKGTDVGVCKVIASAAFSSHYNAGSNTLSIQIIKADQNLTIMRTGSGNLNNNQTDTITVTTNHANTPSDPAEPVLLSVADPAYCTISGTGPYTVTALKGGTCQITASQAGNRVYNPGVTAPLQIGINKLPQTVTITGKTPVLVDEVQELTVVPGGANTPVSLLTNDISLCKLTPTTPNKFNLQALRGGICTVTATQAGNDIYNDAVSPPYIVTINKKNVPIAFNYTPPLKVGAMDFPSTTGGSATNRVKYRSSSAGCEVVNPADPNLSQTILGKKAGVDNCTLEAWRDEDDFTLKAGPVFQTFSVYKGDQIINTFPVPASINPGGTVPISATGAKSGIQLTISVPANGPCSIVVDPATSTDKRTATVTGNSIGTCAITVEQVGNADYAAGTSLLQIKIKGKQILTFNTLPTLTVNDVKDIAATSTNSTIPVTLTSQYTSVCTLQSELINNVPVYKVRAVNATSSQLCTILANQEGSTDYDAATEISVMLNISKANQTLTFLPLSDASINDHSRLISASASSGLPVSFSATPASVCAMDVTNKELVNFATPGVCKITASQAGNSNFNGASSISQDLLILAPASSIAVSSTANPVKIRKSVTFSATVSGNAPTGSVSFIVDGAVLATCNAVPLVNGVATCSTTKLKAGTRSIVASYSGDANNQSSQSSPFTQKVRSLDWLTPLLNNLLN